MEVEPMDFSKPLAGGFSIGTTEDKLDMTLGKCRTDDLAGFRAAALSQLTDRGARVQRTLPRPTRL